jgi:PadR family transcriptional regulator PadR
MADASSAPGETWARELRKGTARLGVVLMLAQRESYGYQIVKQLKDQRLLRQGATESTVYPLLHELEADGFLQSQWRPGKDGVPSRKYYTLTKRGRRYAAALVKEWRRFRTDIDRLVGEYADGP